MSHYRLSPLIILLLVIILVGYMYYSLAERLTVLEIERHGKGYVSDEVWYVPSARNILRKTTSIIPRLPGDKYGASIIYDGDIDFNIVKAMAQEYNVKIVDRNYYKIKAFYVESSSSENIQRFVEELSMKYKVLDVVYGWRIPDAAGINNYLNLEHPPLAKYLIALSIAFLGDYPLFWRIPEIIAGIITVIFTFLTVYKLTNNKWAGIVSAILLSIDPVMRYLSSIALLDIYVALFTVVAFYYAVQKRYSLSIIIIMIGATAKFNTLFALVPVLFYYIRSKLQKDNSFYNFVYSVAGFTLLSISLFIVFQLIVSIPLISVIGFKSWFDQSILGAIKWHTSTKCVGAGCPVSSAPWDWFLGSKGFVLYYISNTEKLVAMGYWPLWAIALFTALLFLPIYIFDRKTAYSNTYLLGILLGYIMLWVIGGKTQYSFYSVQFAPIVYSYLTVWSIRAFLRSELVLRIVYVWYEVVVYIWKLFVRIITY